MPMSASEVVGIDTRDPEGGGCYLVKVESGSGRGGRGSAEPCFEADEAGGGSAASASVGAQQPSPNHHFNVQESTLVISNSSTCTLKLQSSGPFSKKNKNYTVQFNKETTKTTTSSQVWNILKSRLVFSSLCPRFALALLCSRFALALPSLCPRFAFLKSRLNPNLVTFLSNSY